MQYKVKWLIFSKRTSILWLTDDASSLIIMKGDKGGVFLKKQFKIVIAILVTAALSSAITFVITKQGTVNVSGDEKFSKLMVKVYESKR